MAWNQPASGGAWGSQKGAAWTSNEAPHTTITPGGGGGSAASQGAWGAPEQVPLTAAPSGRIPAAPVPSAVPSAAAPSAGGGAAAPVPSTIPMESTLDESVLKTIWRDIVTIARNLRAVLIPVNWKFKTNEGALRNWDLWGPLIFMLVLAIVLSAGEKNASQVFSLVFAEVGLGALVLTLNVILLGGDIVFFQAICLLGYCMFPVDIAAIVCSFVHIRAVRWTVLSLCIVWAALATIPFLGGAVPDTRRALAVYPVLLLYISLGWIALIKN